MDDIWPPWNSPDILLFQGMVHYSPDILQTQSLVQEFLPTFCFSLLEQNVGPIIVAWNDSVIPLRL